SSPPTPLIPLHTPVPLIPTSTLLSPCCHLADSALHQATQDSGLATLTARRRSRANTSSVVAAWIPSAIDRSRALRRKSLRRGVRMRGLMMTYKMGRRMMYLINFQMKEIGQSRALIALFLGRIFLKGVGCNCQEML